MQFPRLLVPRIAVWRSPDDLHVGGPNSLLVLNNVPRKLVDVIELLDGHHSITELYQVCEDNWVDWLLSALAAQAALADGPPQLDPIPIQIHGNGVLARRITMLLKGVAVPATEPDKQILHIVAPSTVEADRVLLTDLVCRRVNHLVVTATQDRASVGPFVIPGLTSCSLCPDLTRRALDPTWPIQAFQLSRIDSHPNPVMRTWASATAVGHIMAFAKGITPESASSTIELSASDSYLTYRDWPQHPECACHKETKG